MTYSRSVRSCSSGGRWSCSATRLPFSDASSPPCFSVSPVRIRSSVVLPAPFGPESATRSRRSTLKDTPSKSTLPANSLRRLEAMTTATPPRVRRSGARRKQRFRVADAARRADLAEECERTLQLGLVAVPPGDAQPHLRLGPARSEPLEDVGCSCEIAA